MKKMIMRKYLLMVSAIVAVAAPQMLLAQGSTPPASFAVCAVCHKSRAGDKSTLGPNLFQIAGRKAGSLPGYAYSSAMRKSSIRWDRTSLTEFLKSPAAKLPGTKMGFAGQSDPRKRDEIVAYLLSLR